MSEQQPKPRNPHRLEAEEFAAWRTEPTTKKVMAHLGDIERKLREAWSYGEGWTEENKQSVAELTGFQALTFDQIEEFYTEEEEQEEDDGDE